MSGLWLKKKIQPICRRTVFGARRLKFWVIPAGCVQQKSHHTFQDRGSTNPRLHPLIRNIKRNIVDQRVLETSIGELMTFLNLG